eukprot:g14018.t1
MIELLKAHFSKAPQKLATTDPSIVASKMDAGRQFVQVSGELGGSGASSIGDGIVAPSDLAWLEVVQESDAFYLVGTGDTGCAGAFATLGALYAVSMGVGSSLLKEPPTGWKPLSMLAGEQPSEVTVAKVEENAAQAKVGGKAERDSEIKQFQKKASFFVPAADAMRTPQFYLLWTTLACNASAGVCVISSAKLMMGDIFAAKFPDIVTAGFTTGFVSALSVANAGGRLVWASCSDAIGRKNTMFVTSMALPACLLVPQITNMLSAPDPSLLPLYAFYATTFAIVSWYGGVLALIPSYTADVFGAKEVNVIYGRLMTGWSVSAVCTPGLLAYLRSVDERKAIETLVQQIDAKKFEEQFGVRILSGDTDSGEALDTLIQAKTVTIKRLLEIAPEGAVDPTPFLYDTTFYSISGILALAAISNACVKRVGSRGMDGETK